MWIDTHCHLDAPEFEPDRDAVVMRARDAGVARLLLPAVTPDNFDVVRTLAHGYDGAYALGIHPLYVEPLEVDALHVLAVALEAHRDDPRLVAVGEIGLDHFVPGLDRDKQERFYLAQLKLARDAGLPVVLHVRRSADTLLAGLRRIGSEGGIAHAFNGSRQQAEAFIALGFKLGFGGAMTHERALNLRRLAVELPLDAIVLETDSPDILPAWLYKTAAERAAGATARNEPCELPRIAAVLAGLRGISLDDLAQAVRANADAALPRWAALARSRDVNS
jgi:TatD DNase family protein